MRATSLFAAAALGVASVSAASVGCPVFDSNFNLYVFGLGQDVVLGAQDSWSSASAKQLPTTGRPPFNGANAPRCHLNQFDNAIYILGADAGNPAAVYIFDVAGQAWSMQAVNAGGIDTANMVEILDHDTNVFYAYSGGFVYFLSSFDGVKTAKSEVLTWQQQNPVQFPTDGYKATMGIAQNHIHFFGTPGSQPGQAFIYVIHFAFAQPAVQAYNSVSGAQFPVAHGQAPSLFKTSGVQTLIAFVPDDMSGTFIVDVVKNTTTPLAAPSDKTAGSIFAASSSAVVQLTPAGKLSYLPIAPDALSASAAWTSIPVTLAAASGNTGSPTSVAGTTTVASGSGVKTTTSGTGTGSAASGSSTGTGSGSGTGTGAAPRGAAVSVLGALMALVLGVLAL